MILGQRTFASFPVHALDAACSSTSSDGITGGVAHHFNVKFSTVGKGLLAGATGVAVMTLSEKLEQLVTKRPNSYVPAHTLERLLRLPSRPDSERLGLNWAMHWGQGILFGVVRVIMAEKGIRGPIGSFIFMNLRLLNDQTLENTTGVGALPWTWPVDEQVIDLLHKGAYAFAAGVIADRLITGPQGLPAPPQV